MSATATPSLSAAWSPRLIRMVSASGIFDPLHDELIAALHACQLHATPRTVHSLRIATRKLGAFLLALQQQHPRDSSLRRQTRLAMHELKTVRQAAAVVRDLDVQRHLLADLAASARSPGAGGGRLQTESRKMDNSLAHRRRRVATTLSETVAALTPALDLSLQPLARRITHLHPIPLLAIAKEQSQCGAEELRRVLLRRRAAGKQGLGSKGLHAYRKQTKAVRYLAEMETGSVLARELATDIKMRLDAIGRWHDLALLSIAVKAALGSGSVLANTVKAARRQALQLALQAVLSPAPHPRKETGQRDATLHPATAA